ncbi:antiholin-like murein hydrolase modulator LrgA [Mammaliicoccus sciuri]|uniref:antiholin-like murein hydrolase modulator LrgA n=1 Tax=Mammaliicoccus sciuri TaxID=1296 RepID=UPI000734FAA0|nr:antiholin-like murein hydrolase modulator LrgA [Mammaliicoccus sciuri]KTT79442.1 murein hydrolase transporter LrgA [Mammaliicoccus sciuri]MBA1397751.1 antiholin-like murein hydrolase modulator LrgA [Mammaliicoccus sciuri]MBG9204174.1 antiholin-like murein hydrolase modulator LrgA [Mammaliicoccus sciuri]MBU6089143.1 antiholin-like murein hydrolase modulator LrgA [Mammaliicoccus sciuri]MBW3109686.1 antiholin-like murein hydrolase modulator LrgA [Mammaliicoccus sciuri]
MKKVNNFFHQALTISIVLLISHVIESFMPIPMPASVIGLVLMFIALTTGVIKLEQVEAVGTALTNNIGFLFVPAGISVINSLGILSTSPILIILLIIISTILLLVCTGIFSQMIIKPSEKSAKSTKEINNKRVAGDYA